MNIEEIADSALEWIISSIQERGGTGRRISKLLWAKHPAISYTLIPYVVENLIIRKKIRLDEPMPGFVYMVPLNPDGSDMFLPEKGKEDG